MKIWHDDKWAIDDVTAHWHDTGLQPSIPNDINSKEKAESKDKTMDIREKVAIYLKFGMWGGE